VTPVNPVTPVTPVTPASPVNPAAPASPVSTVVSDSAVTPALSGQAISTIPGAATGSDAAGTQPTALASTGANAPFLLTIALVPILLGGLLLVIIRRRQATEVGDARER